MAKETKIITEKKKGTDRHWKNFLDKDYLGSHNLEKGEEMLLTIAKFDGEELVKSKNSPDGAPKAVLYFEEAVPKMIMNITNGNTISSLYGSHPDSWIGKQIQIYATPVKAFGKTQDALRVRDFMPKISVDIEPFKFRLEETTDLENLRNVWRSFPASARNDKELEDFKDTLKAKLTK
ncbi:MAG TPA: hypothetical protein ENI63_02015 [Candidatus Kaiserbacteria bacterium]|nr:hypothetical protein [Candidatus Kaiserbacteria bacterium]